ncbi:hypothetical protein [Actinoallomurus acaciae]|uniref:Uncharacterized protein n=1 Tax=Actinoallomurus acaciae TaxID=502577 RepID=A0ABV5YBJ6_9ACTN
MRKKLSAAAGLVTIATAGALIASTPAYAMEDIAPITPTATAGMAPASVQQTTSTSARTVASDHHRRRYRHRRHHRRHRRHFRHHRHHRHFHRY